MKKKWAHLNMKGEVGYDTRIPLLWVVTNRRRPTSAYSYLVAGIDIGDYVMSYEQLSHFIFTEGE